MRLQEAVDIVERPQSQGFDHFAAQSYKPNSLCEPRRTSSSVSSSGLQ
jgi:hypothetical protein